MLEVLPKVAKLQASYALGKPLALPMNLTISVSYRCNSRCKTCNVWQRPNDDFTIEEYDKTFESIGRDAYWFTFSGGEPALRKDLPEMVEAAYRHCRPGIINIPTNGIQDKIIPGRIERVLQAAPTSEVIVNLSLDGVGEKHDIVRGVKGNFERAMRTYAGLKALKGRYKNFTLGVHTVISNFNVDEFENIYNFVRDELKPDSFISEIAEERVELDTVGMGITPPIQKYQPVVERLQEGIRKTVEALRAKPIPMISSQVWTIPYPRNPYFTGREEVLKSVHDTLQGGQPTALAQAQAISGLGGIGKTQTAVEYTYRYRTEYRFVLWAKADTP
jgi:sulfatase maturation enzyme AslB (radical SAM superfamily)